MTKALSPFCFAARSGKMVVVVNESCNRAGFWARCIFDSGKSARQRGAGWWSG
jgi:hypothetical protein